MDLNVRVHSAVDSDFEWTEGPTALVGQHLEQLLPV